MDLIVGASQVLEPGDTVSTKKHQIDCNENGQTVITRTHYDDLNDDSVNELQDRVNEAVDQAKQVSDSMEYMILMRFTTFLVHVFFKLAKITLEHNPRLFLIAQSTTIEDAIAEATDADFEKAGIPRSVWKNLRDLHSFTCNGTLTHEKVFCDEMRLPWELGNMLFEIRLPEMIKWTPKMEDVYPILFGRPIRDFVEGTREDLTEFHDTRAAM